MKVVTLNSKDSFGGAARVALRLHNEICEQGIDNLLLVNNKRSTFDTVKLAREYHDPQNRLMAKINHIKLKLQEKRRVNLWYRYPNRVDKAYLDIEISLLKNALTKIDFDLIHMHWVGESFVNFTELRNINKPIIWTMHDCFSFTGICTYFEDCDKYKTQCGACPQLRSEEENDFSRETFNKKKKRYASLDFHIVSPSRWLASAARESALLGKYPITVIPNGIDTTVFVPFDKTEARNKLGLAPNKKIILFGGISAMKDSRKGGDLLVESLELLTSMYGKDEVQLLVFGAEAKNQEPLEFPVEYLGYIESEEGLKIAYSAADVTVVPSRYENLPTTIMESLSCATPVVAFHIGGNSDMIDHKENGYLAKPYDTEDLANGIHYCMENNKDEYLSKKARQKVLDNFKIEDIANRYIELYKSVLK